MEKVLLQRIANSWLHVRSHTLPQQKTDLTGTEKLFKTAQLTERNKLSRSKSLALPRSAA